MLAVSGDVVAEEVVAEAGERFGRIPGGHPDRGGLVPDRGVSRRLVEDRVWLDTGADAAPGTLVAFLSDGTLVMTSCVEVYRLAPWRWIEGQTLVWEEDGRSIRGEVVLAGRDELILAIDPDGETTTRRFSAALAPVVCPDLPR